MVTTPQPAELAKRQQWNLPDWRDPAQYPSNKPASSRYPGVPVPRSVWLWEFLRRDERYRTAWMSAQADHNLAASSETSEISAARFGLKEFADPRNSSFGKTHPVDAHGILYEPEWAFPVPGTVHFAPLMKDISSYETYIAIIDINQPLEWQINEIKINSTNLVSNQDKKRINRIRHQYDKYDFYLRILDAKYCEVSDKEFALSLLNENKTAQKIFTDIEAREPDYNEIDRLYTQAKDAAFSLVTTLRGV